MYIWGQCLHMLFPGWWLHFTEPLQRYKFVLFKWFVYCLFICSIVFFFMCCLCIHLFKFPTFDKCSLNTVFVHNVRPGVRILSVDSQYNPPSDEIILVNAYL